SHFTTIYDTDMKVFILACLVAVATCRPQEEIPVAIIRQTDTGVEGAVFANEFEADNGINQAQAGAEGSAGQSNLSGSFSVPLEEGGFGTLTYVADENGYQPSFELLPVAPALPAHVVEMLEFVASQQAAGLVWDQSANAWV
ncbi:unnamed protein product, partial [Meganyctiphanes norvegica]